MHPKNKQTKSYQKGRALAMWRAGVLPPHELTAPSEWSYHADSRVSTGRRCRLSVTMQHQTAFSRVSTVSREGGLALSTVSSR